MSLKEAREKINSLTREELTDLMYLAFQGGCLHTRQLTDTQEAKNKHVPMRDLAGKLWTSL